MELKDVGPIAKAGASWLESWRETHLPARASLSRARPLCAQAAAPTSSIAPNTIMASRSIAIALLVALALQLAGANHTFQTTVHVVFSSHLVRVQRR